MSPIVRRIRGNVHGSIDITRLEDLVISHPFFQRLRRVRQLAFLHYVFPGATHTRFEHSLGVMHLAGVAWRKLYENQKNLKSSLESFVDFDAVESQMHPDSMVHGLISPTLKNIESIFESPYIKQSLRLAALLHDLGHPPFSHTGEKILPTYKELLEANPGCPDYLKDYLESRCSLLMCKGKDPSNIRVRHEILSVMMVDTLLNDVYANNEIQMEDQVDPRDVIAIIIPDIEPETSSPLVNANAHRLCRELLSGELDIDRMDYLLRDSRECGVVYGIFDAGRIFDSICLYYDPEDKDFHIAIGFSGLAAFEDYLRARHSMYLQLYFHKTSVGAEAMMQQIVKVLGGFSLPPNIKEYAKYDEFNIGATLLEAGDSLKQEKREELGQLVSGLLYNRNLWKRVYEVTGPSLSDVECQSLTAAMELLKKSGITFEQISSSGSLTRFSPREEHQKSVNSLRLIKKDARQMPRVWPIEDFLQVMKINETTFINRLYVSPKDADEKGARGLIQSELNREQ